LWLRDVTLLIPALDTLGGRTQRVNMLWQDLRFGARTLRKSPGFTLTVILTLSLGIGLNSAIFSLVSGILLREPPVKNAARIVVVTFVNAEKGEERNPATAREFAVLREQSHAFDQIAAASYDDLTLTGWREPERVSAAQVTPNYFELLGMSALLGHTFTPSEDFAKQQFDAVISYDLWQQRFGGDPGIIGKTLILAEQNYRVIGVMPAEFKYAYMPCDVWTPDSFVTRSLHPDQRDVRKLNVLARLKGGVSAQKAETQTATIIQRLSEDNLTEKGWIPRLIGLREVQVEPNVRTAVLFLMGVVGFVLLIACANVAGLFLARSAARQNEFAVRAALGARRWRLMQQLLGEGLLLAVFGGTFGILLAVVVLKYLRSHLNFDPQVAWLAGRIEINSGVLLFTFAVSCLTVLLFGLMPAIQSSTPDLHTTLKQGSRTASPGARQTRIRSAIVIGQVALAMVLMVSAGESVQLVIMEARARLGFSPQLVLTVPLSLAGSKDVDASRQADFFENVVERIQELPGVQSAAATQELPESAPDRVPFEVAGQAVFRMEDRPLASLYVVLPDYFRVMDIPFLRGRQFSLSDRAGESNVVIVNQTFLKQFLPMTNPIGKTIRIYRNVRGIADSREIVGVVGDVIDRVGQSGEVAQMYVPFLQDPQSAMVVVIRGEGPTTLASAVRESVWAINKDQPIGSIRSMKQVLDRKGGGDRLLGGLLGAFTALALGLAAIGIYGVVSHMVARRTHEIGVRIALGAGQGRVFGLVVGGGVFLAGMGTALGFLLALPIPRILASAHPDSWGRSLAVLAIAPLLVIAAALPACYIPARRAMRVDPVVTLRCE
jgi:putative ABC transport system permease protein